MRKMFFVSSNKRVRQMENLDATKCGIITSVHVKSSTWRELAAMDHEYSLESLAPLLKGSHIKWFTDNQSRRQK